MPRATSAPARKKRRKKLFKAAKGYARWATAARGERCGQREGRRGQAGAPEEVPAGEWQCVA
jgi:ribosomal protein L20